LLNLHTRKGIEGSNPSLSAKDRMSVRKQAPLAQLDRASDYESEGQRFKSSRARIVEDVDYMRLALALARKAALLGEVPVGALAVQEGRVVGEGYNRREVDRSPLAHAELLALGQAAQTLGAWRLLGVTLFVTLEPCAMCAGALLQGRVKRLVFGAKDPKAGAVGSLYNLAEDSRHNHQVVVTAGVLEEDCSRALKEFFRGLRSRTEN
jgi:tRNA(adenine34) deaminase